MTQLLGFNSNIALDLDFMYKSSLAKDKLPDGLGYAYHDSNSWTVWKKLVLLESLPQQMKQES